MSNKITYLFLLIVFGLVLSFFFSCAVPEDITEVVYDTVRVEKVDTVFVKPTEENREISPLNFTFTIQIGAFDNRDNAINFATAAKDSLQTDVEVDLYQNVHTVIVGAFDNNKKAESFLETVKSKGFPEAFIRRK